MVSVGRPAGSVKLHESVAWLMGMGRRAYVQRLRAELQRHVEAVVAQQAGRWPGERTRPPEGELSAWRCSRCGGQHKCDFNYNGSYRRVIDFAEGSAQLRIPRLRCCCGGNVRADFGALLLRRVRHWYDLVLTGVELMLEGESLRAVQRYFTRRGVQVGLSSLARMLGGFAGVDLNAGGAGEVTALSLDAAFWRAGGALWAHLYVHAVEAREAPLVRHGRAVAWHGTGKVLGVGLAGEESQAAWEAVLRGVQEAGLVDSSGELFVASDGNRGLLSALDLELPWSIRQRCVWHIGYRTRDKIMHAAHRQALEHDALWVFRATDVAAARERLGQFMARWRAREPVAAESVGRKFVAGVEYLRHPQRAVRPRTIAISERYNQEAKRRLRPGRAFGSERNLRAMVRLLALRHNCLIDRTDWLHHAARWRWDIPVEPTTAYQHKSCQPAPYTNDGT